MFRLLRFYALSSLVIVIATAVLLIMFFRHVAIETLTAHGEASNVSEYHLLTEAFHDQFVDLIRAAIGSPGSESVQLSSVLQHRLQERQIVKIKMYSRRGITVFSTDTRQIGENQASNAGVQAALKGETLSSIVRRESYNALDGKVERRDLLQTYLPVVAGPKKLIIGVFEIYTDYSQFMSKIDLSLWIITGGVSVILLLLYGGLIFVVRYSDTILQAQGEILHQSLKELSETKETLEERVEERTRTLAVSNQVLEQEIEERAILEEALVQRQVQLRVVMDNAFIGIITVDQRGTIRSANPMAATIFGYREGELIGMSVAQLMPEGARMRVREFLTLPPDQRSDEFIGATRELDGIRRDGSQFPLELAVTKIDEGGSPLYITTLRDISQRRNNEAELQAARQRAFHQQKMAAIGTLAAGIVHEIGNPISAISGLLDEINLQAQEKPLPQPSSDYIALIQEHIERILQISHDVSEFSAPQVAEPQLLDLNDLVSRTVRLMRHDERLQEVEIVMQPDRELPALLLMGDQVIQVIMNLLTNSIDAIQEAAVDKPEITISTQLHQGRARLSVSDNGIGMLPEAVDQAAEAFYTTKSVGKGIGLGLSLCHTIITSHQGVMTIESDASGTTVHIDLPLAASDDMSASG